MDTSTQPQGFSITRLRLIGSAVLLSLSSMAMADSASQAEQFLKPVHADRLMIPVYVQVQQMLAQRFTQAKAPESKKAVLECYQIKANAELDCAIDWDKIKPELIKLYTTNLIESESKDLNAFYQSPLGKRVLEKVPRPTAESAQLTQAKLQGTVEPMNKLMADMDKELGVAVPVQKKK